MSAIAPEQTPLTAWRSSARAVLARPATRNVIALVTGTSISQLIPFALAPFMTRIYSPEDYGGFALYSSFGSVIAVVATAQYHSAVMLPEKDEDAIDVLALSLLVAAVVAAASLVLVLLFGRWVAGAIGTPELEKWLFFIPFGALATGAVDTLSSWTARTKSYQHLARVRVGQQVLTSGLSIILGISGVHTLGMIVSAIVGQAAAAIALVTLARRANTLPSINTSSRRLTSTARQYQAFPRYTAPQSFLDNVSTGGIALVFGRWFPLNALGKYSLGNRVIQAPVGLIGSSVATVFYQEAAARHARGEPVWPLARKVIARSAMMFGPSLTLLALSAPILLRIAFGSRWEGSAPIIQALTPWIVVNALTSPVSTLPQIVGRQREFFYFGIGYNIVQPTSLAIAVIATGSVVASVWCMSLSAAVYLLFVLAWFRRISIGGPE